MKTATVADLRNQFRRVSAWLDNGETVRIVKRGKLYAHLSPAPGPAGSREKIDFAAQRRRIWGRRKFTPEQIRQMRQAELKGEEG